MAAQKVPVCDKASHEALKVDAETFAANTTFIKYDPAYGLIFANCNHCPSTLCFDPDGEDETEPFNPCALRTP